MNTTDLAIKNQKKAYQKKPAVSCQFQIQKDEG